MRTFKHITSKSSHVALLNLASQQQHYKKTGKQAQHLCIAAHLKGVKGGQEE